MKEFKGTKGEWIADKSEVYRPSSSGSISPYWKQICSFVNNGTNECKANAKLIAAAPELLEALQNLIDANNGNGKSVMHQIEKAQKAIEKALK